MDYKKRVVEGAKLATVQARLTATTNHVYVCVDKKTNQFEFIPLENVVLFPQTDKPITLKDYLNSLETTINGLSMSLSNVRKELEQVRNNNTTLATAVEKLSEFIDNQKFL